MDEHSENNGAAPTTVDAILAAARQIIAERGPDKLRMSVIAETAGVSRVTLYRWFPTKDDLLAALTAYEEEIFNSQLRAAIEAQRTPNQKLDAALRLLVTYLDGMNLIGANPGFAIRSLARSLGTQTESLARLLGSAFDAVPAVRHRHLTREQAAELFLRLAYSHYLVPHAEPEVLLANLRSFAGLSRRSMTTVAS